MSDQNACNKRVRQGRTRTGLWTAVAERSGDTALLRAITQGGVALSLPAALHDAADSAMSFSFPSTVNQP